MRRWAIGALALAAVFAVVSTASAQQRRGGGFTSPAVEGQWYGKSVALVVGINSYGAGWGRLGAAVNDARRMAGALRAQDFEVYELYEQQATSANIVTALRKCAARTGPGDRFVFYYAGHGYTQKAAWGGNDAGFLVPIEGRAGDSSSYVPMEQLRNELFTHCRAKHALLLLDCCFSGALLTRASLPEGQVADYLRQRGVYGITAGMNDQPAVDGLFTSVLIDGLDGNADYNNDGFVTFKELGLYVEQNVRARNRLQTPDFGLMAGSGQMVFARSVRGRADIAPAPPPPKPAGPGYLSVATAPWVEVYLDGSMVGTSPIYRLKVQAGRHTLRLWNAAKGIDRSVEITVEENQHLKFGPQLPAAAK